MTIELHIDGRPYKTWIIDYSFGPFPMRPESIYKKELDLERSVLECKIDADHLIYDQEYQMFAVVQSGLRPWQIDEADYEQFLALIAYNKKKASFKFKIERVIP
jgi:hypothetical protein